MGSRDTDEDHAGSSQSTVRKSAGLSPGGAGGEGVVGGGVVGGGVVGGGVLVETGRT